MGKMRLSDGIDVHYGEYAISGTSVIDSNRNLTNIGDVEATRFRASGADVTPAGTTFANAVKGTSDSRTMYFDGNGTGVSTWYGVGNNPFAAIDCTDGVMDFWVNPSNGSWYNIFDITTNGIKQTYGTRIHIDSSSDAYYIADGGNNAWKYLSLQTSGSTNWDIATKNDDASGALQFRPAGSSTNRTYMDTSGNWNISGNISLSGTVDGRDVASDGSKLDGIESGATADQSASEILTAIKTVDGSGSGLDADLLDGQHGSHYLNYNNLTNKPTIPTNNNQLTNGAGYTTYSSNQATNTNSSVTFNSVTTGSNGSGTNFRVGDDVWLGDINVANHMSIRGNQNAANGYIVFGNANNTALGRAGSGHLTYGSSTVWHAGNDGSGSGLDADLLDGTQKVNFVHGSGSRRTTNSNPNTALNSGFYDIYQTNAPTSTWYSYITMAHTNTANEHGHQIAGSFYSDGDIYNRHYDGTTASFGNWTKIWNAANDGSGSGLDADTLDGNHASAFLTDVLASSGLAISGSGSTRTLSMSGSYTGTFTLLGDFLPHANDTYDLGSTAKAWKELHVEDIRFHNASGAVGGIGQYNSAGDIEILSDHNIIFKETDGNAIRAVFGMNGPNFTFGQTSENTSYRVYVNGSIASTADVTAYASDERLKTNIVEIDNPIEKVKQLRGVTFDWQDDVEEKGFEPSEKHETGVIAQEVQKVIPDAVVPAPFDPDYLTVKHEKIVPLLIEAIKDQQKQIEYMKEELKTLKGEK